MSRLATRSRRNSRHPTDCRFTSGFSTPPRGDAVTFNFWDCDHPRHGLPPCRQSVLTGRTHDQARPGHLHRMVADWDCIVRNLLRVADGQIKPSHDVGGDSRYFRRLVLCAACAPSPNPLPQGEGERSQSLFCFYSAAALTKSTASYGNRLTLSMLMPSMRSSVSSSRGAASATHRYRRDTRSPASSYNRVRASPCRVCRRPAAPGNPNRS